MRVLLFVCFYVCCFVGLASQFLFLLQPRFAFALCVVCLLQRDGDARGVGMRFELLRVRTFASAVVLCLYDSQVCQLFAPLPFCSTAKL